MKKRYSIYIIFILMHCITNSYSQDIHYSQFYANPVYLNPSLTGNTQEHRLIMNYRNQWPGISKAYSSQSFTYDYNAEKIKSGFGLVLQHDKSGIGGLRYISTGFNYRYQLKISRKLSANAGLGFAYCSRDIDFSNLVFNDQLYRGGGATTENQVFDKAKYLDVSTGTMLYTENIWLGFSAHHLNKPNESLNGLTSVVPVKVSLHGGYKHLIPGLENTRSSRQNISPAFNYRAQDKFDQLDLGVYYTRSVITIGTWYRGIPVIKKYAKGYQNNDAVTILVGYIIDQKETDIRFGYSYDLTISKLATNSGGAHEISIIYEFADKNKKKRGPVVPCAKF